MKLTETIYPKGMETHPNEELWVDDASGKERPWPALWEVVLSPLHLTPILE